MPPGSQEPGGFFADFHTDFTRIIRKKQQGTFAQLFPVFEEMAE